MPCSGITGEDAYAAKGVEILNAWSGLKYWTQGQDFRRFHQHVRMNNAAEILKYYHGGYVATQMKISGNIRI